MAISTVGVAEPVSPDKFLHSWQRTIAAVDREDQFILPGQNPYPTYTAIANNISVATSADHVLMIQADGTNYSRLVRAWVTPTDDIPAAASVVTLQIVRTTTAGSSGSAVTAGAFDTADTYAGTIQTLPSSKGTEGAVLWQRRIALASAQPVVIPGAPFYEQHHQSKPIVFGAATASGIVLKVVTGVASCTVDVVAEFIVTPYL